MAYVSLDIVQSTTNKPYWKCKGAQESSNLLMMNQGCDGKCIAKVLLHLFQGKPLYPKCTNVLNSQMSSFCASWSSIPMTGLC